MEKQLRQHSITFTFAPNIKSSLLNWIKIVQTFLSSDSFTLHYDLKSQSTQRTTPIILHVEEVLETTVIQLSETLISNLGYPISTIRYKSASLLSQLASILDERFLFNDPKVENVVGIFMADNIGNLP